MGLSYYVLQYITTKPPCESGIERGRKAGTFEVIPTKERKLDVVQ